MDRYTEPNLKKSAIITVDTQNGFTLPGAIAEMKGTNEIIPRMKPILETGREKYIPIIHLIRIYNGDGSNVDNCRRELIETDTEIVKPNSFGADLVDLIKPQSGAKLNYERLLEGDIQPIGNFEWVIYKPGRGAFFQTKLEEFLRAKEKERSLRIIWEGKGRRI